jgi:prephenate dehydrogenase
VDEATLDPRDGVEDADLVVFAPPVLQIPPLTRAVSDRLAPGAIVTDVGSTKAYLEAELPPLLPSGVAYVGGHPMAGSEQGGIGAARADLFNGAVYVLTRPPGCPPEAAARVAALARRMGAKPVEMAALEHDAVVARTSHLPHVVAAALAGAAARGGGLAPGLLRRLAAGGFRDTTRVAESPPEMWRDVCLTNAGPLLEALADCEAALVAFRRAVERGDGEALLALFAAGREARRGVFGPAAEEEE